MNLSSFIKYFCCCRKHKEKKLLKKEYESLAKKARYVPVEDESRGRFRGVLAGEEEIKREGLIPTNGEREGSVLQRMPLFPPHTGSFKAGITCLSSGGESTSMG
jgi:hypothetical protein